MSDIVTRLKRDAKIMGAEAHEHVAAISRIKAKQAGKLVRETRTTGAYEEVVEELAPSKKRMKRQRPSSPKGSLRPLLFTL